MKNTERLNTDDNSHLPAFGYDLLRSFLLPELLGKEHEPILYWAGKTIARRYPLETTEEVINFFEQAGWGALSSHKQKRTEQTFQLTSPLFSTKKTYSCQLEAGFLAQQIEQQTGFISEALVTYKKHHVLFTVETDRKDPIERED